MEGYVASAFCQRTLQLQAPGCREHTITTRRDIQDCPHSRRPALVLKNIKTLSVLLLAPYLNTMLSPREKKSPLPPPVAQSPTPPPFRPLASLRSFWKMLAFFVLEFSFLATCMVLFRPSSSSKDPDSSDLATLKRGFTAIVTP
jgi:hypothetical protein